MLGKLISHSQQPVDEAVEVGEDVGVEVAEHCRGVPSGDAFVVLDLAVQRGRELAREQLGLQEVVVFVELGELVPDVPVLLAHELVQFLPHFVEEEDEEFAILQPEGLDVVLEVAWGREFVLELFAPLGEEPQQLGGINAEMVGTDLLG